MPEIILAPPEILAYGIVGLMRQTQNLKLQRRNAHGSGDNDWQLHVEGALGEAAFAKFMGLWPSGAFAFRGGDVGCWQVRTRSHHEYDLILHRDDADDNRFVLITGRNGTYVIRGWILGRDGKQDSFWKDPAGGRPAFFVPQSSLITDFRGRTS